MQKVIYICFMSFFYRNGLIFDPIADLLNSSINCFVKFTLSLVDKVTIGTCNLASVIFNFAKSPNLDKIQSSIKFNSRRILQLINDISSDLKKLLRHFSGTTIFVFFTKLFPLL